MTVQRGNDKRTHSWKTAALLATLVGVTGVDTASADTIELTGILRDFKESHPDMNHAHKSFGVRRGLVLSELDAEGKPVLDEDFDYSRGMITGPESFTQWFRDVKDVNISSVYSITLDNGSDEPGGVYSFAREKQMTGENQYFFPLDDAEAFNTWGDQVQVGSGWHNFYFTFELTTNFTYTDPAERDHDLVFSFTGDDDVWVFINGQLAVDIGGVHGQAHGEVNLDDEAEALGLEVGETYPLVLFFAERHVSQSNFRVETTLELEDSEPTTISPLYD